MSNGRCVWTDCGPGKTIRALVKFLGQQKAITHKRKAMRVFTSDRWRQKAEHWLDFTKESIHRCNLMVGGHLKALMRWDREEGAEA
jgi:hypothetical protein